MNYKLIKLPKISDGRGNLTYLEKEIGLPFKVKRVFWTYDVQTGEIRGGHAYKSQNEVICVVSGSADIIVTSPNGNKEKITLNRPDKAVYIPKKVWRHIENFASNTVTLHFSDSVFNPDEYIRDINELSHG